MSKKDKLIKRLYAIPSDFTYEEMKQLLEYYGFEEVKSGKTSGSSVKFYNKVSGMRMYFHRPHPGNIVKKYILRELIEILD